MNDGFNFQENGEAWLAQRLAQHASVFVDVGANVGDWSGLFLQYAPPGAKGYLYEPSQCAFDELDRRFRMSADVRIVRAFVADKPGEIPFYEEPGGGQTSSFSVKHSRPDAVKKIVPVTTLDMESRTHGWTFIDLLKVDAEGYDLHVLRGAQDLLTQQRIGAVQFEYNEQWASAGSTLAAAYQLLESSGYEVFLLKSAGLYTLDYAVHGEYFEYSNFVAVSSRTRPAVSSFLRGRI